MKLIILKFQDGTELGLIPEVVGSYLLDNQINGLELYKHVQKNNDNIIDCLLDDFDKGLTGYVKDSFLCWIKRAPVEWYLNQEPEISIQNIDLADYK